MSRYSWRASSGSTASARTSPPPGGLAIRSSLYGSGWVSNSWAMPCRPSTSTSSVRRPPSARPSASAAATLVLPVPPLPVTTCSRAGQRPVRSFSPTTQQYGRDSAGDLADEPVGLAHGGEGQLLLSGLLVVGRHGELHGHRRTLVGLPGHGRFGPAEGRRFVLVAVALDLIDPPGQLVGGTGLPADQLAGGRGVLPRVDGGHEVVHRAGRVRCAARVGVA